MRNSIKVSVDGGIHYSVETKPSDNNFKAKDDNDVFGASGLDIPPDNIDDVFCITSDASDLFFNKDDIDRCLDEFDDNGDLVVTDHHTPVPVPLPVLVSQKSSTKVENRVIGLDVPTDEINDDMIKFVDHESDLLLDKITDVSEFFDGSDDDKGDLLVGQETGSNLRKNEARVKDDDQKSSCMIGDRRKSKRTETSQETTKSAVVKNLNENDMEIKLADTKRKIREGYQDEAKKKRKIKVIDYIPQTTVPKKPCKTKKDCFVRENLKNEILQGLVSKKPCKNNVSMRQNSNKDYVPVQVPMPKKARICDHKRKDDLFMCLKNDGEQVPVPKKPRTCDHKRKDDSSRPERDQVKTKDACIREIVVALPAIRRR